VYIVTLLRSSGLPEEGEIGPLNPFYYSVVYWLHHSAVVLTETSETSIYTKFLDMVVKFFRDDRAFQAWKRAFPNHYGDTLLHATALFGSDVVAKFLIDKGANLSSTNHLW